jgi:hypothetical protein
MRTSECQEKKADEAAAKKSRGTYPLLNPDLLILLEAAVRRLVSLLDF